MPSGCSNPKGAKQDIKKNPPEKNKETKKECPLKKVFEAKIIEIIFKSHVKVCRKNTTVPKDFHWKEGISVKDGMYSKRPAVYLIKSKGKSDDVIVKIQVTKSQNISGNGKLSSKLGAFAIEGQCPLTLGIHDVKAKIKDLPDSIQWYKGDTVWGLEIPDLNESRALNTTRVELFSVLDTPLKKIYQNKKGVWVEALRFLCKKANVLGVKTQVETSKRIAQYTHGSHKLKYDNKRGAPHYGVNGGGGTFLLGNYLKRSSQKANCYDQAAALQALCGAVGVELKWIFMAPFGYINKTDLLGWGQCNNPFWKSSNYTSKKIVPWNDPKRSGFGNHAFCDLGGKMLDSCAEPHTGNETKAQYVTASIDSRRTPHGGVSDMTNYPGLDGVS